MRDDSGELLATVSVAAKKAPKISPTASTIDVLGSLAGQSIVMQVSKEVATVRVGDKGGHRAWASSSQPERRRVGVPLRLIVVWLHVETCRSLTCLATTRPVKEISGGIEGLQIATPNEPRCRARQSKWLKTRWSHSGSNRPPHRPERCRPPIYVIGLRGLCLKHQRRKSDCSRCLYQLGLRLFGQCLAGSAKELITPRKNLVAQFTHADFKKRIVVRPWRVQAVVVVKICSAVVADRGTNRLTVKVGSSGKGNICIWRVDHRVRG